MPEILQNHKTLARTLILKISIRLFLVIIISSLVSFWFIKKTRTSKEIDFLENYTRLRNESERHLFEQAVNDVEFIRHLYEDQINTKGSDRNYSKNIKFFDQLTYIDTDKAVRTKREYFDPNTDPGIFITKDYDLSDNLKNDVTTAYNIIRENYNIWAKRYLVTWVVYDGIVSMTLSPKKPNVVYETEADFRDKDEDYYTITDSTNNPDHTGKWTNLYFDPNFKSWMISYTTPIIKNNKKIAAVGVDIYLEELFSRIINIHLPNSYNFIVSGEGKIVVHPQYIETIKKAEGNLDIAKLNDPQVTKAYDFIKNGDYQKRHLLQVPESDVLYGIGKIPETNWYLVTVFPKSYLEKNSQFSLYFVLWSSFLYLIIELLILYITLREGLSKPLKEFIKKIAEIHFKKKNVQFPIEREDELGNLAKTFTTLQKTLETREHKVKEYTENLEILVQERTNKLEKALKESKVALEKSIQAAKLATLGEVASGLSHELNSPIMVLKGTAHQIQKGLNQKNLDLKRLEHLIERLKGTTKKMTNSVNSLRIFSRNPSIDQMRPTNLQNIFTSALNICYEKFRFHQVQIQILPDNYGAIEIFGKETQLAHALLNIFNNSFDAISSRQDKWIRVDISEVNDNITIDICDSGPLITKDLIDKIFVPYFTTKIGQNRTGLGLSITQKIIEEHNGKIEYVAYEGFNHFLITLPKNTEQINNYHQEQQLRVNQNDKK